MLVPTFHHSGIVYLFTGVAALLILAVLFAVLTTEDSPSAESEPLTPFGPEYLARVPDDVRRIESARGVRRRFLTMELLANCTWECSSQFRDVIGRIRR
jgi:hypothetical protein